MTPGVIDAGSTLTAANRAISREAVEHAAALIGLVSTAIVRNALYTYGRRACTPEWARTFPDARYVDECTADAFAGLDRASWATRWNEDAAGRWRFETRRSADTARGAQPVKLYVNAGGAALVARLPAIVERIAASDAAAFKVASDPWGLLRSDKCVVYLRSLVEARRLAAELGQVLADDDVQQLAFTAALDERGAVSLGFDPPQHVVDELGERSWRGIVCGLLEVALVDAVSRSDDRPVEASLAAVAATGIDTVTWAPIGVS
ncbi:hypothetical protein ACH3VR_18945 [Microbacterium sp. B2969]|uniref:Uncharacterized protein n=1 Tax=Microbacterium alkaliflavum TaxID=3248839 RepID=A0ABW7QDE9_9MICO